MTSKIKVDNINKVSDDSNIINKCGTDITMGQNGDTVIIPNGVTEQVQSGGAIQVQSGGSLTIASGATITNNGTAVGLGRTGTVDWITTPKTATFTAVSGEGYFCNTSGGAFTVNLPAGVAGAIVSLADYAATWQTNAVTVSPNGTDKIGSVNVDVTLSTEGQSVTFVFVDSTQGWINTMDSTSNVRGANFICASVSGAGNSIATVGGCKVATFTGPGTFTVNSVADCSANNEISYIVVAGGGGGGGRHGGAGGAGGFREDKSPVTPYTASPLDGAGPITVTAASFPITVGGGGTAGNRNPGSAGTNGANSVFSTITSTGGGRGYTYATGNPGTGGQPGGSGGGGGHTQCSGIPGGAGNTPPVSPSQGNNGGSGTGGPYDYSGGGGGGATANGATAPSVGGGAGGAGATTSINGTPTGRAGGGGGGNYNVAPGGAGAATDGGGAGGGGPPGSPTTATAGTANTGGGGGGYGGTNPGNPSPTCTGGNGGSGVVIIRYKSS
jgi:hypothetical protein